MWDRLFASEVGLRSDGEADRRDPRAESTRLARRASRVKLHFAKPKAITSPGRVGR